MHSAVRPANPTYAIHPSKVAYPCCSSKKDLSFFINGLQFKRGIQVRIIRIAHKVCKKKRIDSLCIRSEVGWGDTRK